MLFVPIPFVLVPLVEMAVFKRVFAISSHRSRRPFVSVCA